MAFAAKRAREHTGRLLVVVLVVAVVVTGNGGLNGVVERMLTAGASRMFAQAEPDAQTLRVQAREAQDAAAQDHVIREAIDQSFAGTGAAVSRSAAVDVPAVSAHGHPFTIGLLSDDRLPARATLTGGKWPTTANQFAMQLEAARRAQLSIGDTITLTRGDTELTLVGTWTADNPAGPAWHGDPRAGSGENDGTLGPAAVTDDALATVPTTSTITWEIAPADAGTAELAALQRAASALRGLPAAVDPKREHNIRIVGALDDTLRRESVAATGTRGLLLVPLLIIALHGALVLGVTIRTLTAVRRRELYLLRARGGSARRFALEAAAEGAIAAVVGAAIALGILGFTTGRTPLAWLTALSAIVWVAGLAAALAVYTAARADHAHTAGVLRAPAGTAFLLPTVLAGVLSALAGWRLFSTGSVARAESCSSCR